MKRKYIVAAALKFSSLAAAQVASNCADEACFKLNIPASTASSGSGDIFFQISAPTSYEWVALGQGTGMKGANIFVVYASADGNNVTLSPRLGTGHVQPDYNGDAQVTLLDGSGVSNGSMIANVRCSSCNTWSGGSASFSGDSGDWIYAYLSSGSLKSDDTSASISQHSNEDTFQWSYASAKGGSSANPLAETSANGTTSAPVTTLSSNGQGGQYQKMLIAHGVLAALAFVILFPAGAITIRLASFPGVLWVHAAFQAFAYIVYIAAFGLGVYIANDLGMISEYHPIIGIVVFAVLFFQPIGGWLHHRYYKKHGTRSIWSHGHIWLGRILITLGIINGGLGMMLADANNMSSNGGKIAYGVIAGVIWLIWVGASVFGERKRRTASNGHFEKHSSPTVSPETSQTSH